MTKGRRTERQRNVSPRRSAETTTQTRQHRHSRLDSACSSCKYLDLPSLSICPIILWTVGAPHDVTTNLRHSSLSSAFLTVSLSPKPVHSQMLSSHRFLCLPLLLPPCTVPWRNVLARPEDLVMCPYHCSLRCFTMVKSSL